MITASQGCNRPAASAISSTQSAPKAEADNATDEVHASSPLSANTADQNPGRRSRNRCRSSCQALGYARRCDFAAIDAPTIAASAASLSPTKTHGPPQTSP
ncbi:hypothetical protein AAVH_11841 [Aphelenchoides avenae]|nr:hypothetical protein AAVH_11841 [Aphelenchus avenae]